MVTHTTPTVQVRRACPADAGLLADFLEALSERSHYRRFSAPPQPFTTQQIQQMTSPDSTDGVRLIAVERTEARDQRIVGLAQLFGAVGAATAEGALVITDRLQRHGLGSTLCARLLHIARQRRVGCICGLVQSDNHCMLALARKRGYPVVRGDDGYELRVPVTDR